MASPILMPKLGLTMEVGIVSSWLKKEGDPVRKGEAILEVETDKIVTEVQAPETGLLLKIFVGVGAEVKVQTVLALIGEAGEDICGFSAASTAAPAAVSAASTPVSESAEPAAPRAAEDARLRITPRARRLLEENGFTAASLEGLGKARITEADVQEFLQKRHGRTAAAAPQEGGQLRPFGRIEKIVAARMTESFRDIPQFSLRFVAELDGLLDRLPRMKEETGVEVSINDLFLRAAAIALARSAEVQYQYRPQGIFMPGEINLGFAVAIGRDIVVPVIRNADAKRIGELSREAASLAERARADHLRPPDMEGGTFTVSNLGMFGISSFVPIVNPGEGAILGVGAVQSAPRLREGGPANIRLVELTLVCDHRCVNGATGAAFCRTLKQVLESPGEAAW